MKKLLTLFVTLSLCFTGKAQWNPVLNQNLLITKPGGSSFSAAMSDGKTYIGYWKQVTAPTNFELWLQILDQNGNKLLGNDGVMISNQISMDTYTSVEHTAVDSSNNLYIGVNGTGADNKGYIFKITPQGTSVWPDGIDLGSAFAPMILPLSNGDILAAYWPYSESHTKVQRFNASGQPVWSVPVSLVSDNPSKDTIPADLFELPNQECEIIFHKQLTNLQTNLFAQKINFAGNLLWSAPKQISTQTTLLNVQYEGILDGNVLYYGYNGLGTTFINAYLQRINADGGLPWGADGVDFDVRDDTYFEKDMKIAHMAGSPYIWSIANYSSSSQGQNGEFVQKFDKNTGERLFSDQAKQVFPIDNASMFHKGSLHLVDGNPFFMIQKNGAAYEDMFLDAVLLTSNGDFAWVEQSIQVATFAAQKQYIELLKPINGQSVAVFQEKKDPADTTEGTYVQNILLSRGTLSVNDVPHKRSLIRVYPNPAFDNIYIEGIKDQNFEIYSSTGQLIKAGVVKQGRVDVKDLVNGIYILKLKEKEEDLKFIKK